MPPAVCRRRRHAESDRRAPQRQTILDRPNQREPARQSELGVSVQIHPCPPLGVGPGRPTASKEGRIEPQPFTTSVGRTTSSLPRSSRPLLKSRCSGMQRLAIAADLELWPPSCFSSPSSACCSQGGHRLKQLTT